MPTITKASRQQRETIDQFVERDQQQRAFNEANYRGVIGTLEAAAGTTLTRDAAWALAGQDFEADEGFQLDSKMLDSLTEGVDEDLWPIFAGARSTEHALYLRANAMDLVKNRREINAAGVTGQAAQLLANVFDPVTLGAGLATGGVGAATSTVGKLTKSAMAVRGAAAGVGSGIVTGAIRQEVSPTARGADFAQDVLLGATLGGFGAAGRGLNRVQRFTAAGGIGAATNVGVEATNAMITDNDEMLSLAAAGQAFLLFGTLGALPRTASLPKTTPLITSIEDARVNMNKRVGEIGMRMLPPSTLNDRTPEGAIRTRGRVPLALPERATPANRANDPVPRVIDTDGTVIEIQAAQEPAPAPRIGDRQKVRNYAKSLLDTGKYDETSIDEISLATGISKEKVSKWVAPVVDFARTQKQDVDLAGPLINEPRKVTADNAAAIANLDWMDDFQSPIGMFVGLDDVIAQAADSPLPQSRQVSIPEPVSLSGERLRQANQIADDFDLQAEREMAAEVQRIANTPQKLNPDGTPAPKPQAPSPKVAQAIANSKAKRARGRSQFKTPGGSRPGALASGEILDAAYQAAATVLKGGVRSAKAIGDAVESVVTSNSARANEYLEAKAKILAQTEGWVKAHLNEDDLTTSYTLATTQPPPDLRNEDKGAYGLYLDEISDAPSSWVNPVDVVNPMGGPGSKMRVGTTRWDTAAVLAANPNPLIRWIANATGYDPLPKQDSKGTFSTSDWIGARRKAAYSQSTRGFDQVYDTYVADVKAKGGKPLTQDQFDELPAHYVRGDTSRIPSELLPAVKEAVKVFEASRKFHVDMATKHGVAEARQYTDPTYIPREWVGQNFVDAIGAHGQEAMEDLLAGSISQKRFTTNNTPNLPGKPYNATELALGRAIIRHALRNPDETITVMGDILDNSSINDLVSILQSEGVSPQVIESIRYRATTDPNQPGVSKNLKARIDMDENFSMVAPNGQTLRVSDFLNNNIRHLEERLHQRLISASALAELHYQFARRQAQVTGDTMDDYVAPPTGTIPGDIISRIKALAKDPSDPLFVSSIDDLEYLIKLSAQVPVRRTTNAGRVLSTLKSMLNFKALSGVGSALQNLSDLSDALAIGGARIFMNRIPTMVETLSTMRKGIMPSGLMREIQAFGLGVDYVNGRVRPMVDSDTGGYVNTKDDTIGKVQRGANQASRVAMTPFAAVNEGLRRTTSQIFVDRFYDFAKTDAGKIGKGGKTSMSSERLADLGLDEAAWKEVATELNKHATTEQGWLGEKVASLNLERWNPRTAARMHSALNRLYNISVTEANPTAKARWMTSDVGALFTQLRNFSFFTHSSKTLRNLYFKDKQAAIQAATNAMFNGLIRAGIVFYNSIGREDQQDYLNKNLDPETFIVQSLGRANFIGLSTIAADTLAVDILQRNAIFSGARASTVGPGGVLFGNPTFQTMDSARKALGSVQAPFVGDYSFSRDDVRNIRNSLFVPDFFGLHRVIDALGREAGLPQRSMPRY